MQTEHRILEVRRDHVLAQPLDGIKPEALKIAGTSKYVENEVIIVEPHSAEPGKDQQRWKVIATRIDPSFIGGRAPEVAAVSYENEHEFMEYVSYEDRVAFDGALEDLDMGDYKKARRILRKFIKRFPYHIDAYHHLGIIETNLGHDARALKYFEMGYRIGILSIPKAFSGQLPWGFLRNRPFLRAAHGYGLALERERRHLEAVDVYEQILAFNPNDNQGIRYLLPSLYLEAKSPQKARASLEKHGADGTNLYTRCLIEILDGRRREAVRWLCRGLSYNLYVPEIVLLRTEETSESQRYGVVIGSRDEAIEYVQETEGWHREETQEFLRRLLAVETFAWRLERALELKVALDSRDELPPGELRSATANELYGIFTDQDIPKILEECSKAI
ncbi:Tetratricopeptide repeat protein [Novipirellula aureliae]|uniref:Tetratricopeptide repeat protein n=1 Tax=Novipirellula aureliae TaxID=2527966 RepID=A0A5C6E303_9BACT|nr:tetratricopeptide repeat protein [Novipirellula aureliae]TWU43302.1 Tetratricopeptide repeat protein [Novipirellula aureliae]